MIMNLNDNDDRVKEFRKSIFNKMLYCEYCKKETNHVYMETKVSRLEVVSEFLDNVASLFDFKGCVEHPDRIDKYRCTECGGVLEKKYKK